MSIDEIALTTKMIGKALKANIKLRRVSYLKLLLGTFKDKSDSLKEI